ncbi:hypothetical protein GE09DRAFT_1252619 [Coniochaeta sp. 2T2.1]|nr:hypothetical protein GE09DRAFT_1252619 [Coniochaeta sp. 2T2.1]
MGQVHLMGVRQGHPIVATMTVKEAEIHGLNTVIKTEVRNMLDKTADAAINDVQGNFDDLKARITDHKSENTRDHNDIRKEISALRGQEDASVIVIDDNDDEEESDYDDEQRDDDAEQASHLTASIPSYWIQLYLHSPTPGCSRSTLTRPTTQPKRRLRQFVCPVCFVYRATYDTQHQMLQHKQEHNPPVNVPLRNPIRGRNAQ